MKVKTITLNGADVTMVAQWADAEAGEVGLYPHRLTYGGAVRLLDLSEMVDLKTLLPLVTFGPDEFTPKIAPDNAPIITVHGDVAITFHE